MARHAPKHAAPRHYRGRTPAEKPVRMPESAADDFESTGELPTESFTAFSEPPAVRGDDLPDSSRRRVRIQEYEEEPTARKRRSPVVPIVLVLLLAAAGIIVYILWSLGLFGSLGSFSIPGLTATATPEPTAEPTPTPEPTPSPTPSPTPEPTPPPIYDDGTEGYMSSNILIYDNKAFEMFYGNDSMAQAYAEMINTFADSLPGMQVYNMVVPNHSEFGVPERVREYYGETSQRQNTDVIYQNLSDKVTAVDIYDVLNLHNNENIYLNTDTHWAPLGAYYAYTKFCEAADCDTAALESFDKTTYEFTGYLAYATYENCLFENPDTLDLYDPTFQYDCEMSYDGLNYFSVSSVNSHDESAGYSMYLSGDMGCVRVHNYDVQTGRRLVIVKDSYGNALAPFLMASFDEVHVIDFRYFDDNLPSYCAEHGITDVLFFNNEMSANTSLQHDAMWSLFG